MGAPRIVWIHRKKVSPIGELLDVELHSALLNLKLCWKKSSKDLGSSHDVVLSRSKVSIAPRQITLSRGRGVPRNEQHYTKLGLQKIRGGRWWHGPNNA